MSSVRKALALSFLERYLSIMLALASNMVLARLLTPHEIGLYSVTLAVIGVAQVLRDFGIGNYLIQEKDLGADHIGTAFGVSLLLGGGLFTAVFLLAPLAADFYAEPSMGTTMRIAALNFLVLPFCTVRMALLRRAMRFKALLYVSLASTILSLLVTVALAWAGWGADSMAIGSVVLNLVTATGTWLASDDRQLFRPTLRMWRPLLNFGGQSALTNVVTTVSMDANDLVVGKVLGLAPVAQLSRAQGLMNLFHRDVMGAVRNVAFPALASAHREQRPLGPAFVHAMSLLTLVAWAFYGLLAVYALEALRLLFGPQWDAAAPLVPLFCAAGAVAVLNSLTPTVLLAIGRVDLVTRVELLIQPLRLVLIVLAAVLLRSLEAVAVAYLAAAILAAPCYLLVVARAAPGVLSGLLPGLLPSALVALVAVLPALGHTALAGGWGRSAPIDLWWVVAAVAAGMAAALLVAERIRHPVVAEPAYRAAKRRLGLAGAAEGS